jgi:hypothetical protein
MPSRAHQGSSVVVNSSSHTFQRDLSQKRVSAIHTIHGDPANAPEFPRLTTLCSRFSRLLGGGFDD